MKNINLIEEYDKFDYDNPGDISDLKNPSALQDLKMHHLGYQRDTDAVAHGSLLNIKRDVKHASIKAPNLKRYPKFEKATNKDISLNGKDISDKDVFYKMDLADLPVFSNDLKDAAGIRYENDEKYLVDGDMLFYGWTEPKSDLGGETSYFVLGLTTNIKHVTNTHKEGPIFYYSGENEHEMYEILDNLLDAIGDVKKGLAKWIDPYHDSNGKLTEG